MIVDVLIITTLIAIALIGIVAICYAVALGVDGADDGDFAVVIVAAVIGWVGLALIVGACVWADHRYDDPRRVTVTIQPQEVK